jgi:tRNA (cytosine49-C5)-methyltransferase
MEFPEFKPKFVERYSVLTDIEKFRACSIERQRKSLRVNTLKVSISELKKRLGLKLKQVPWCKEGFFIDQEVFGLGNLPEHGLGYFYVQEASSMVPVEVLKPKPGEFVLDMAAAPGSKTTQMAAKMKNKGLIVANDADYSRMSSLNMNVQRSGITNCMTTLLQGRFFRGFEFDRILLDAPCSGTGTISKSPRTIMEWNPFSIRRLAGIQKQLIRTAFENLKEGGVMTYSTCTLEPEEDEGIVNHLLERYENAKLEKVELNGLKSSKAVTSFGKQEYDSSISKCLRIWPQDNHTDGFFVAKIKKV